MLNRLSREGLNWYRNAKEHEIGAIKHLVSASYSYFEGNEIHMIGQKPVGTFSKEENSTDKPFQ